MKVKIGTLVAAFESGSLPKLANDSGLPVKTTFRLARIWKRAIEAMEDYNRERVALGHQHGKLVPELNKFEFSSEEDEEAFQKGGRELVDLEVEFDAEPFVMDDFGPRKISAGDFLSANDLLNLEWLIVETRPEAQAASA